jgi:hypothetical protein
MNYQKITSIIFTFLIANVLSLSGQMYEVKEGSIIHRDNARECIEVHVDPEPKTIKGAWKDYLKDNYNFKLKGFGFLTNKDLLSAEDIQVEKLGDKNLNFYSNIIEDKKGTEMKVFASFGYDIYINPKDYAKEFVILKNMVKEFYAEFLPDYYAGEIKDVTKRIAKLEKERKSTKKDIEDNQKDIEDNKEKIEDLQKENEELAEKLKEGKEKLQTATERKSSREAKLKRIQEMVK